MGDPLSYAPSSRVSALFSGIIVDWVFGVGILVVVALLCARAVQVFLRARALDEETWRQRGLRNGPVVLAGIVDAVDDLPTPLIEVRIRQVGGPYSAGRVQWSETDRGITCRPFVLITDGGNRVFVEGGTRIELHDAFEPTQVDAGAHTRERVARIDRGDKVWVRGTAHTNPAVPSSGPYRGDDQRAVLRPIAGAPLLISSVPVGADDRAAARFNTGFALAWLTVFALAQCIVFGDFRALRARGIVETAKVTGHRAYESHSRGSTTVHHELSLRYSAGAEMIETTRETSVAENAVTDGDSVPIVVDARHPATAQLGRMGEIGIDQADAVIFAVYICLLTLLHVKWFQWRAPWWRRLRLVELEPGTL